jgi:hypothetical protein
VDLVVYAYIGLFIALAVTWVLFFLGDVLRGSSSKTLTRIAVWLGILTMVNAMMFAVIFHK